MRDAPATKTAPCLRIPTPTWRAASVPATSPPAAMPRCTTQAASRPVTMPIPPTDATPPCTTPTASRAVPMRRKRGNAPLPSIIPTASKPVHPAMEPQTAPHRASTTWTVSKAATRPRAVRLPSTTMMPVSPIVMGAWTATPLTTRKAVFCTALPIPHTRRKSPRQATPWWFCWTPIRCTR